MSQAAASRITNLLAAWNRGEEHAWVELAPKIYGELERLAGRRRRGSGSDPSLETRDLLHEALLRVLDQRSLVFANRAQFYGFAAQVMRNLLVDHARRKASGRHGGGWKRLALSEIPDLAVNCPEDFLALNDALATLRREHPALAGIVELRCFGGLDHEEIAAALEVSVPTVKRRWRMAKAWLLLQLA